MKHCKPCEGGLAPISAKAAKEKLEEVPGWNLSQDKLSLQADYLMKNFKAAITLIRKVAEIAESENHHPDIHLTGYRKLSMVLSTHAIGGLSENDFILAAKINRLPKELKQA